MFTDLKVKTEDIIYSLSDVCPCCGNYTPDGNVCTVCQKKFGIYEPKISYIETE